MEQTQIKKWSYLFLGAAFLFGIIVRISPAILSDFPINDGGMFYVMIEDLLTNDFKLPLFTTYNNLDIPYMYPPFSFYFTGSLSKVLDINLISLFQFLPAIVSSISVIAFYFLAKNITNSHNVAVLGTLSFALIPATYSWFVMGGGISRSLYLLFYILATNYTYHLFTNKQVKKNVIWLTILFNSLVVLSHPEAALQVFMSGILLFFIFGRNRSGTINAGLVGAGVLVFTSIWYIPVIQNHGLAPVFSAFQTGGYSMVSLWFIFVPSFGQEQFFTLFSVLALIGLAIKLQHRKNFLVLWFALPLIVEPRSGPAFSIIPMSILAGIALSYLLTHIFSEQYQSLIQTNDDWPNLLERSKSVRILMAYIVLVGVISAFYFSNLLSNISLSSDGRSAMQWVHENTPEDSKFITITGSVEPFSDPTTEWFPALTNRENINTIQGQEWLLGNEFSGFKSSLSALQNCNNEGLKCVKKWAEDHQLIFNYIYIQKTNIATNEKLPALLNYQLTNNDEVKFIYENNSVIIYKVNSNLD